MQPRVHYLKNAIATPTVLDHVSKTFTGVVYDSNGDICIDAQRSRAEANEWQPSDPQRITPSKSNYHIPGKSLYLGHYTGHYGHFLLETLSRFWVLKGQTLAGAGYDRVVFHPFVHKCPSVARFSAAQIVFSAFGIPPNNALILSGYQTFEHLTVPQPLFEINFTVAPPLSGVYRQIVGHALSVPTHKVGFLRSLTGWAGDGDLKIYVSRRRARGYHPMRNERAVESVFRDLGFKILHPERWRFEQQVALFQRAEVLAGVEGSALHNSVFMRPSTRVISIGTPREPSGDIFNQRLCDSLSGVSSTSIPFVGQVVGGLKARYDVEFLRSQLKTLLLS